MKPLSLPECWPEFWSESWPRSVLRRCCAVALCGLPITTLLVAGTPVAQAQSVRAAPTSPTQPMPHKAPLPQRNLLVEVRQGEASRLEASGGGVSSGGVVIGTDGQGQAVQAHGSVGFEARQRDAQADAVTQLRVLNGAQGLLSLGTSIPVEWYEVAWTPRGPAVVGGQRLVDTGRRVAVRPSWPGGNQPVTVEVRTEASAVATGGMASRYQLDGQPLPPGAVESAGVLTTLQLPLGQWVTVARDGSRQRQGLSGTFSTRDVAVERGFVVQMRVTAP